MTTREPVQQNPKKQPNQQQQQQNPQKQPTLPIAAPAAAALAAPIPVPTGCESSSSVFGLFLIRSSSEFAIFFSPYNNIVFRDIGLF